MNNLKELIDAANSLSSNLEKAANQEKQFCFDICQRLEQMSWEMYRAANELNQIQEYIA